AKVAAQVIHAAEEPFPNVRFYLVSSKLLDLLGNLVAKVVGGDGTASNANYGEFAGEQLVLCQIVESGNQFSAGEIAGSAKNYHRAGIGGSPHALLAGDGNDLGLGDLSHRIYVS